jgi:hypothetical protein
MGGLGYEALRRSIKDHLVVMRNVADKCTLPVLKKPGERGCKQ